MPPPLHVLWRRICERGTAPPSVRFLPPKISTRICVIPMSEPKLIPTKTTLPLADIRVRDRLRPTSQAGVDAIVESIREIGHLISPVVVRQVRRGGELSYEVLDGAHRLNAAALLNWEVVPVAVYECTDDQARIMEIDGNLSGAELDPLDTAVFLATRKALYERLHPETKRGVSGGLARQGSASELGSFAEITAKKFGLTVRQVQKIVAAGSRLGAQEVARLRAAPKAVTLKDLQELAKICNTVERYDVVDLLAEGRAKSAADARKVWKVSQPDYTGPAPIDPVDKAFLEILNRFDRLPMAAKRRFVEERWPEFTRIMRDAAPVDGEDLD